MRAHLYMATGLLMLAGCGQSSDAAPAKSGTAQQQPAPATRFDIAGVSVGDNLAAATAALRRRNFRVDIVKGGWSFDDWVEKSRAEAAGRLPSPKLDGPSRLTARNGPESIYADIRASADGGVIELVSYSAPSNGRPRDQQIADVKSRYAGGVQPRPGMFRICAKVDPDCTKSLPQENHVQFVPGDPFKISIFPGRQQKRRWETEFNAQLARRLGPAPASY